MALAAFGSTPVPTHAKWAFTTRRVCRSDVIGLTPDLSSAAPGDLVLGEVTEIGQHKRVQLSEGRYSTSFVGDVVVLTCGDRYAPDQFEAVAELDPQGADLIAAGGVLGRRRFAHARMSTPTQVRPLGLLVGAGGEVINIARYALPLKPLPAGITVIGVAGSSMNAGKTTAAVSMAHGLSKAGYRVAGLKATGTGAFGDFNAFRDAGIPVVADFTDAGMASTYRQPLERIERGFEALIAHAVSEGAEVAVVELADGVCQRETAALLHACRLRDALAGVLLAAPDALSAIGSVFILRQMDLVPFALSGMVSCSPLATAEAEASTGIVVISREDLCEPTRVTELTQPMFDQPQLKERKVA